MKDMLRVFLPILLCLVMLTSAVAVSSAEDDREDSEASLRWLLADEVGSENFEVFEYGDYDGDGIFEAFVFVGNHNSDMWSGDLWFVSPLFCEAVQTGLSYLQMEKVGNHAPILFTAEEWYGGSGSVTHLWSVVDSAPVVVEADIYGGFEVGEGNEFYSYPSAFDGYSDGTGHTWKQYYYYLDGMEMREYGGIYITRDQLMLFDGANEIVQKEEAKGYALIDIIYRENGIINLNFQETGSHYLKSNTNITLRYEGSTVTVWREDMGIYELASDPARAVYPAEFVPPSVMVAATAAPAGNSEASMFSAWMQGQGMSATEVSVTSTPNPLDEWIIEWSFPPINTPVPSSTKAGAGSQLVQATADVNVRSGPGLDYSKLGTISYGESFKYLGESRQDNRGIAWYKMDYHGNTGWVSSKYATVKQGSASSGNAGTSVSGNQVYIQGGKANIRSGPGLNYESVGSLNEGRVVEYLGKTSTDSRGVDWHYINFNGKIGWVSSKYGKLR